jgi:UDP-N-acetyl-D-galactosamine dehydrogenase
VAHHEFGDLSIEDFGRKLIKCGAIIDLKSAFDAAALAAAGYRVWRL